MSVRCYLGNYHGSSNGALPISLFHEDGFMCKNAKSELVVMLESSTSPIKDIPINPINTVIINDGMAFIQSINVSNLKTINDLTKLYMPVF